MDKGSSIPSPHHARRTGQLHCSESLVEGIENILGLILKPLLLLAKKKDLEKHLSPWFFCGSGAWIRTMDLRVMSPTSYQTAPPRNKFKLF